MTTFDLPLITFWQRPAGRKRVSQQVAQIVFSLLLRVLLFFFFFLPSVFDMGSSLCCVGKDPIGEEEKKERKKKKNLFGICIYNV